MFDTIIMPMTNKKYFRLASQQNLAVLTLENTNYTVFIRLFETF